MANKTPAPLITSEAPPEGDTVLEASSYPEIQKAVDEAEDKGFVGVATDPVPNEHYTVAGQIKAKAEADKTK